MDHPPEPRHLRLPGLYREILDVVAELEHHGDRQLAARVRREAVKAYSTWDGRTDRRLIKLVAEARRGLRDPGRPRSTSSRSLRGRWARVRHAALGTRLPDTTG
jgi:hypothetical protein